MTHLPPGRYYIGDPCFVFQDNTWNRILSGPGGEFGGTVEFEGRLLWGCHTAFGDGTYTDQNGVEYGVDSGLIGAVPIELIDDPSGEKDGLMIDAPEGLNVDFDNGTFWIGPVCIRTRDVEDYEDQEFLGPGM